MKVSVEFEWTNTATIELGPDGKLKFPNLPLDPGLYRLWLGGAEQSSVYIGETENLRRRASHYRTSGPSQRTNIRLNDRLRAHLAAGGKVEVAILTVADVEVEGKKFHLDLSGRNSSHTAPDTLLALDHLRL